MENKEYNLTVNICGVEFKNPIIAASGTFGFGREYNQFYDIGVLGGISSKGLTLLPREGNKGCRVAETPMGMLNSVGLQNPGVEYFIEHDLPFMKKSGAVAIANIAGNTEEDYLAITDKLNPTDVDMLELNISCPNVKEGGIAFGVRPETVLDITRKVKAVCKKPLIVKLSPNVASIADNAKAAAAGGADAISLINTLTGMAVDWRKARPILGNITGGLSGPAVKPVALYQVWQASRAVDIPVIGMGGIANAEDVLDFILCGASAVMVGTQNISHPMAGKEIVDELTKLVKEYRIDVLKMKGSLQTE